MIKHLTEEELVKAIKFTAQHHEIVREKQGLIDDYFNSPNMKPWEFSDTIKEICDKVDEDNPIEDLSEDMSNHLYDCFHCKNRVKTALGIYDENDPGIMLNIPRLDYLYGVSLTSTEDDDEY